MMVSRNRFKTWHVEAYAVIFQTKKKEGDIKKNTSERIIMIKKENWNEREIDSNSDKSRPLDNIQ